MESDERKRIRQLSLTNTDLRRLYMEHLDFERKLSVLDNNYFLTTQEQMLRQTLKKRKLAGKEEMVRMAERLSGTA